MGARFDLAFKDAYVRLSQFMSSGSDGAKALTTDVPVVPAHNEL